MSRPRSSRCSTPNSMALVETRASICIPASSRGEIDELNSRIFERINNGVYKCGFARTQEAYNDAFHPLFAALDEIESRLSTQRYLVQTVGNSITLADIHLFTTLVRFDAVYFGHFKCNLRRVVDYANLWSYVRDLYQTPGFGETVHIDVYKKGYYGRSAGINPRGDRAARPGTRLRCGSRSRLTVRVVARGCRGR